MVEISRDGKRVYWTNSLYSTWDNQFYPDGVPGALGKGPDRTGGGLALANDYWVEFPEGHRAHQDSARRRRLLDGSRSATLRLGFDRRRLVPTSLWLAVVASGSLSRD